MVEHIFLPASTIEYLHYQWCFSLGGLGIGIFTFVSGYLIARSLEGKTVREYALSRFWRVYPAYLTVLLLALGVFLLLGYSRLEPVREATLRGILAQAFFVRDIFNLYNPLISADWTLLYEVQFYIVGGIAWFGFRRSRRARILIVIYIALTAILYMFYWILSIRYMHGQAAMQRTGGSIFCFTGMLYYLHRRGELRFGWATIAAVWALGAVAFSQFRGEFFYEYWQVSVTQVIGTIIAVCCIVWRFPARPIWIVGALAGISFPLYLLHQTFGTVGFSRVIGSDLGLNWFWDRSVTFALILIPLSVVIHLLVEKPGMRMSRTSRRRSQVPQSA